MPQFFKKDFILFNRRITLEIVHLNEIITNYVAGMLNVNFLISNIGYQFLGIFNEHTHSENDILDINMFCE